MNRRLSVAAAAVVAGALIVGTSPRPAAQSFGLPPGARAEAPDPNVPLYFEVASVRPNKDGGPGMGINRAPGGSFRTVNTPPSNLITGGAGSEPGAGGSEYFSSNDRTGLSGEC